MMINIRSILCWFGIHHTNIREVHLDEKPNSTGLPMNMVILNRCSCGQSFLAKEGNVKPTIFVVSEKFVGEKT